jgi:hypothetical protein
MTVSAAKTERTRINQSVRTGANRTQNHITHAIETGNHAQALRWIPGQGNSRTKRVDRETRLRQFVWEGILLGECRFKTNRGLINFMKNTIRATVSIALAATGAFAFSASTADANEWMCNTQAQIMMTDAERANTAQCGHRPATGPDLGGVIVSSSGYATEVRLYGQNGSAVFWINSDRAAAEAWLATRTN